MTSIAKLNLSTTYPIRDSSFWTVPSRSISRQLFPRARRTHAASRTKPCQQNPHRCANWTVHRAPRVTSDVL